MLNFLRPRSNGELVISAMTASLWVLAYTSGTLISAEERGQISLGKARAVTYISDAQVAVAESFELLSLSTFVMTGVWFATKICNLSSEWR